MRASTSRRSRNMPGLTCTDEMFPTVAAASSRIGSRSLFTTPFSLHHFLQLDAALTVKLPCCAAESRRCEHGWSRLVAQARHRPTRSLDQHRTRRGSGSVQTIPLSISAAPSSCCGRSGRRGHSSCAASQSCLVRLGKQNQIWAEVSIFTVQCVGLRCCPGGWHAGAD